MNQRLTFLQRVSFILKPEHLLVNVKPSSRRSRNETPSRVNAEPRVSFILQAKQNFINVEPVSWRFRDQTPSSVKAEKIK